LLIAWTHVNVILFHKSNFNRKVYVKSRFTGPALKLSKNIRSFLPWKGPLRNILLKQAVKVENLKYTIRE